MIGLGATAVTASAQTKFEVFDAATAADVEALTSQIIPSDDGPGAREAGVIHFIDRALATFDSDKRGAYRTGMRAVQQARTKLFPASTSIGALSPAQQMELIRAVEKTDFFELLRTHTGWGFLAAPQYGGNRNQTGWTHIGFEHQMHFEPPFGYYDAQERDGRRS
jgi:gluconate 2-dehydrogenase gamma chain